MPLEPIEESDLDRKKELIQNKEPLPVSSERTAFQKENSETERMEGRAEKDDSYARIISKIQSQSASVTSNEEVAEDANQAGVATDAESRINNLVDIAMQKGVFHAVKVAKHLKDNYVLDEFHDKMMMDDFHDALIKKGLIKDV